MIPIEEDEEPTFFQRFRIPMIVAGIVVIGVAAYAVSQMKPAPKKKANTMTMVSLAPPPPPPPPVPTPPPKEEPPEPEKAMDEPKFQEETQPQDAPPEPAPSDDAATTANAGPGSDGYGLKAGSGRGMIGGTGKGKGGTKYGYYAGQVQNRIVEALKSNKKTRSAALNVQVKIWADSTGRVTRAMLAGSSGNAQLDQAITNEILSGLQLSQPPPQDMPMPIVMRISAKRPN